MAAFESKTTNEDAISLFQGGLSRHWMTSHKNLRRFCSKSSLADFDLVRVSWVLGEQTLAGSSSAVFLCQPLSAPNPVHHDGNRICNRGDCLSGLGEPVSEVKRGLQLLLQSTEGGTPPP